MSIVPEHHSVSPLQFAKDPEGTCVRTTSKVSATTRSASAGLDRWTSDVVNQSSGMLSTESFWSQRTSAMLCSLARAFLADSSRGTGWSNFSSSQLNEVCSANSIFFSSWASDAGTQRLITSRLETNDLGSRTPARFTD